MKKLYFSLLSFLLLLIHGTSAQSFSSIDIWSGSGSSYPYNMTTFNGKVYFNAQADTAHGYELWVSDGTTAGTSLFMDIWPGPASGNPQNFTVVGNMMFFTASDSLHGNELWITDGTVGGTTMVYDICPGPTGSFITNLTVMNGKLYFAANDSIHGDEPWVSDGTVGGTSLIKDIYPGTGGCNLFAVSAGPGPEYVGYSPKMTQLNNKLYFAASDQIHGRELWATDGTTAGTSMVADIWPGPGSGFPYCITAYNGKLIMGANDSVHGSEIWISDGTAGGTALLDDINPGTATGEPGDIMGFNLYNGKLYFDATTAASGRELWATDGTTQGTTMVKDILPGPGYSIIYGWNLQEFNGKLFFNATDSVNGLQLWTSDGTSSGTTLFKVLSSYTPYDAYPGSFIPYNGSMIFIARTDSINLKQLFITDGTPAGTHMISPPLAPNANPMGQDFPSFAILNDNLFMCAGFTSIGTELWIYGFPLGITAVGGEHTISAYPNPFSSAVTIAGLEGSGQYTVEVVDMAGREFYHTTIDNPSQSVSVSMPELNAGIYIMRISGQGSSQTFKLIKN